ncbi:unnamed protein product [Amoebophrya sp. A25]|nr:unnamed protein product [Amoebophrya sp. A25]|eukprot:GSA25T00019717001.1
MTTLAPPPTRPPSGGTIATTAPSGGTTTTTSSLPKSEEHKNNVDRRDVGARSFSSPATSPATSSSKAVSSSTTQAAAEGGSDAALLSHGGGISRALPQSGSSAADNSQRTGAETQESATLRQENARLKDQVAHLKAELQAEKQRALVSDFIDDAGGDAPLDALRIQLQRRAADLVHRECAVETREQRLRAGCDTATSRSPEVEAASNSPELIPDPGDDSRVDENDKIRRKLLAAEKKLQELENGAKAEIEALQFWEVVHEKGVAYRHECGNLDARVLTRLVYEDGWKFGRVLMRLVSLRACVGGGSVYFIRVSMFEFKTGQTDHPSEYND